MPTYHIRPGRLADVHPSATLYIKSFGKEALLDYMFPSRHADPTAFHTWVSRKFQTRWWTPGYFLTLLVEKSEDGAKERPVGFTWWERPVSSLSFRERWLSPFAWFSPIVRFALSIRNRLFPIPTPHPDRLEIYSRVFASIQPTILNSPRRHEAWYLASLGVEPELQGKGLGSMLLRDGLREVDEAGVLAWLSALANLEKYYERYGFVEVGRCNVGELKDWDGGAVMFRGEE
ncbi:Fc.00g100870.m01.CDS01 [Cosmosporella sp. VM-42]